MTLAIELSPEEEKLLLARARQNGRDPVEYAQQIIRDHIGSRSDQTVENPPTKAKPSLDGLIDHEFVAACAIHSGEDVPTIEEARQILAKVPGSLAEEIIADREDRF